MCDMRLCPGAIYLSPAISLIKTPLSDSDKGFLKCNCRIVITRKELAAILESLLIPGPRTTSQLFTDATGS